MHTPSAQPFQDAVLQAATAPLREVVGDRVRVDVEGMNRIGPWVFLRGRMRDVAGGRPNFSGTAYEKPSAAGQMSDVYVALLREAGGYTAQWQLLEHKIGPSDVAWDNWPEKHSAPRELFRVRVT